jgi:hypothetical protein
MRETRNTQFMWRNLCGIVHTKDRDESVPLIWYWSVEPSHHITQYFFLRGGGGYEAVVTNTIER